MARFEIDPEQSQIWMHATSSIHAIDATCTALAGWFEAEVRKGRVSASASASASTSAHLEFALEHLATGNPLYDLELRRRVDAGRCPAIIATLTAMVAGDSASDSGWDSSDAGEHFRASGEVTFHGVTKSAADDLEVRLVDDRTIVVTGESGFDIRDFDLDPPRVLGFKVHPEVQVRLRIVAVAGANPCA